jgi:transposase
VPEYSAAFKTRVLQRLVGPHAVSATALAKELGVSQESLSRWLRQARSVGEMPASKKQWTGAEKLRVVTAAAGLTGSDLGAFLRREGLHEAQLAAWREAAEAALGAPAARPRPGGSPEAQRIGELERELRRKDRALAETAALLVLKKKVRAIWGDEDDATGPPSER